jgi:hypothetical protein
MQDVVVRKKKVLTRDYTRRFHGTLTWVRWRSESEHAQYHESRLSCAYYFVRVVCTMRKGVLSWRLLPGNTTAGRHTVYQTRTGFRSRHSPSEYSRNRGYYSLKVVLQHCDRRRMQLHTIDHQLIRRMLYRRVSPTRCVNEQAELASKILGCASG